VAGQEDGAPDSHHALGCVSALGRALPVMLISPFLPRARWAPTRRQVLPGRLRRVVRLVSGAHRPCALLPRPLARSAPSSDPFACSFWRVFMGSWPVFGSCFAALRCIAGMPAWPFQCLRLARGFAAAAPGFPYLAYTSARVHLRGFPSLGFVDLSFGAPAVLPRRPWLPASCLFSRTFPRPFLWVSWISLLALLLALRVSPLRLQLVSFPFLVSCMACPFLFLFLLTL
jgi:hypothetical protein